MIFSNFLYAACIEDSRFAQGNQISMFGSCVDVSPPLIKHNCPDGEQLRQGSSDTCIAGTSKSSFDSYLVYDVCSAGMVRLQGSSICSSLRLVVSLSDSSIDENTTIVWNTHGSILIPHTGDGSTVSGFVLSGDESDSFDISSDGEIRIKSGVHLDYQDKEYHLIVSVTDGDGDIISVDIIVTVTAKDEKSPFFSLLSPQEDQNIVYNHITLALETINTTTLTAINDTLAREHNRSITIKGKQNNQIYYIYNLPLIAGENDINITATNELNETVTEQFTLTSDANGTAPIGMRATSYSGVERLDANITIGTLLDVEEYLLDSDGDGVIDQILQHIPIEPNDENQTEDNETNIDLNQTIVDQNQTLIYPTVSEGNFTVRYTVEGRYKPRVTIRTEDNLLYSSDYFAMALDVKADADQKDPKGAEPMDVAKEFVTAIVGDDRERMERLTGSNKYILALLYGNEHSIPLLKDIYNSIDEWGEKELNMDGKASIHFLFDVNSTTYAGGFELKLINTQLYTGRKWIITFIY